MAMKKLIIFLLFLFFCALLSAKPAYATVDPLSSANNRFGIHILDASDIPNAKNLVNSSGGDWGYVTMVIRENERDIPNWQEVFNNLRRSHLIPILRLATKQKEDGWEKFREDDIQNWVYFLNSLNWVVQNRYVVIGNEPNHANEWGGEINPEEYSQILCSFSSQLKSASENFFVLPAGLDASAPSKEGYMDEELFIGRMLKNRDISDCIDGWVSHSYPNPNFSGSEKDSGRGTITTYKWERQLLKSMGIEKNLPIFITETGWAHTIDNQTNKYLNPDSLSQKFSYAFEKIWTDPDIVAITPFVLNYQEPPFEYFSWIDKNGKFYPFYQSILSLAKTKGQPAQIEDGEINFMLFPKLSREGAKIQALIYIRNYGQAVWNTDYQIVIDNGLNKYGENRISASVEPGKSHWQSINIQLPQINGPIRGAVFIQKDGKKVGREYNFEILTFKQNSSFLDKLILIKSYIADWLRQKIITTLRVE
jgi:hypothetical protein